MLPDCECKGRAFLHSLQEIAEKKCEKISFAPILPLHSIAKSAVKPIFSPLPHPAFFTPKSPFFPLFPVLSPFSGDFSRDSARFLPCEAHFFSSCLVLDQTSDDFSRNFSRFSLRLPHFQFMLPHPSPLSPTSFLIPPHFSIFLPNKRTIVRTLVHYVRTRTPAHTRTSGGFRLLPSPLHPPITIHCAPMR